MSHAKHEHEHRNADHMNLRTKEVLQATRVSPNPFAATLNQAARGVRKGEKK